MMFLHLKGKHVFCYTYLRGIIHKKYKRDKAYKDQIDFYTSILKYLQSIIE